MANNKKSKDNVNFFNRIIGFCKLNRFAQDRYKTEFDNSHFICRNTELLYCEGFGI